MHGRSPGGDVARDDDDDDDWPDDVDEAERMEERRRREVAMASVLRRLAKIRRVFRQQLSFLLLVMQKIVETGAHPHLQELLTRLNFNGFYRPG